MTERHYQMRRLDTGDYLLPANSVENTDRYYRIIRWQDGPHLGAERNRIVWSLFAIEGWKLAAVPELLRLTPHGDPAWSEISENDTRAEAVADALRHDADHPAA